MRIFIRIARNEYLVSIHPLIHCQIRVCSHLLALPETDVPGGRKTDYSKTVKIIGDLRRVSTDIITLMKRYDLCFAWNWEYDTDFSQLLRTACQRYGLSLFSAKPENITQVLADLGTGDLAFSVLFDRASESDAQFQPLVDWAYKNKCYFINPQEQSLWAVDKANMHLEFISQGLDTPYTILLPPFAERPEIPLYDLNPLGGSFAVKPASMGGGEGVVLATTSWDQVLAIRQQHSSEKYLLQAFVMPKLLGNRPAWFRVLVCDGAVFPCWWDQRTHLYARVSAEERFRYQLGSLSEIGRRIANVSHLDLFSTEIALTESGRFLVVDYVNDPVDLRVQSNAIDGVPNSYVEKIAERLARLVGKGTFLA
jgi:hypothetical protein